MAGRVFFYVHAFENRTTCFEGNPRPDEKEIKTPTPICASPGCTVGYARPSIGPSPPRFSRLYTIDGDERERERERILWMYQSKKWANQLTIPPSLAPPPWTHKHQHTKRRICCLYTRVGQRRQSVPLDYVDRFTPADKDEFRIESSSALSISFYSTFSLTESCFEPKKASSLDRRTTQLKNSTQW